jgi:hypothetical protein
MNQSLRTFLDDSPNTTIWPSEPWWPRLCDGDAACSLMPVALEPDTDIRAGGIRY